MFGLFDFIVFFLNQSLSNSSDLSRGPIEQSNRMASAPTKKAAALLEQKESFPKVLIHHSHI
jgi:hypothetical protein